MKNLMFVLALLVASTAVSTAQDAPSPQPQPQPSQDYRTDPPATQNPPATPQDPTLGQDQPAPTGKEIISAEELPQTITNQLEGQDYSGFTIQEASKKMRGDETIYQVELTSGDQLKKIKFDDQGNILKEKTKRNKG